MKEHGMTRQGRAVVIAASVVLTQLFFRLLTVALGYWMVTTFRWLRADTWLASLWLFNGALSIALAALEFPRSYRKYLRLLDEEAVAD
jgi:hypothetical protein